jgi:hypothetical protein
MDPSDPEEVAPPPTETTASTTDSKRNTPGAGRANTDDGPTPEEEREMEEFFGKGFMSRGDHHHQHTSSADRWASFRRRILGDDDDDEVEQAESWIKRFSEGIVTFEELHNLEMVAREPIFTDVSTGIAWCSKGDLGYIFGPRGLGKTWLSLYLAVNASTQSPQSPQSKCGPWQSGQERIVLYLDGENAPQEMKLRCNLLGKPTANLLIGNHQIMFERIGGIMNLANIA